MKIDNTFMGFRNVANTSLYNLAELIKKYPPYIKREISGGIIQDDKTLQEDYASAITEKRCLGIPGRIPTPELMQTLRAIADATVGEDTLKSLMENAPNQVMPSVNLYEHNLTLHVSLPDNYNADTYKQTAKAAQVAVEYLKLFAKKQESYGVGNIDGFGELGVLVRVNDKVQRLKQLVYEKRTNDLESVEDTWLDLLGYALIGLLVHRNEWR